MRAARAAMRPALLGASHARRNRPERTLRHHRGMRCGHGSVVPERQVVPGTERICGDEQRRAGVGARSALRTSDSPHLFERRERSERSELCGATPDRAAQCSRRAAPTATVERTAGRRLPRPVEEVRLALSIFLLQPATTPPGTGPSKHAWQTSLPAPVQVDIRVARRH